MSNLQPRIEDSPALLIAGLSGRYHPGTTDQIAALWGRFVPYLHSEIPGRSNDAAYGVCFNDDGETFEYLCGIAINNADTLPPEFKTVSLPASRYAVFTHVGPIHTIGQTWRDIFALKPEPGIERASTPSFEWYSVDFNAKANTGRVEIWMPVKTASPA